MNKMIRSLLTLAAFGASSVALLAQPAFKLVVVDMAKVYDSHYKTEEANLKFRDAEQKATEQVEELNKQGQSMVDEYKELTEQSNNTVLTAEARGKAGAEAQKKMEDIQRKQGEVQNFRTNTQRSLQQRIKTHRDLLLEEITKIVNNLAKLRGATLVVDKSGPTLFGIPSVLYADPSYDMTEEVVLEVNKDRPATAAKPTVAAPAAAAPVSEKK
jgi:outer membrane protein